MLNQIRLWLRTVLTRRRLDREMQEEMAAHLERAAARLELRGLSPEEARRLARREFGNVEYLQEQGRDARGARWIETIIADLRFGVRHFARVPVSTLTMILILALGIGVNTVLFTVLHSVLTLPPAGITRNDALVRIRGVTRIQELGRSVSRELPYPELLEYARHRELFEGVAGEARSAVVLDLAQAERFTMAATAVYVTDNYFRVLGVRPVVGDGLPQTFPADAAPALVAVISHALWDQQYGRSPDVIGKTLRVNGVPIVVVGVGPPGFTGTISWGNKAGLWLPLSARAVVEQSGWAALSSYDSMFLTAVARTQPNVTPQDALPTVQAIASRAAQETTAKLRGVPSADVVPLLVDNHQPGRDDAPAEEGKAAGAITMLILLITCTNVSVLLVGLAAARRREIAVRLSLGAARSRLIRQLLTEGVLLASAGAVLAVGVVWLLMERFRLWMADVHLEFTWPAVLFTFGIAIGTGLLFGISPALHATRLAVADVLKDSATAVSASRSLLQRGLVVAQIALTQPLLIGLGALVLIVVREIRGGPVVSVNDHIVAVSFDPFVGGASFEQNRQRLQRIEDRLTATPGVQITAQQRYGAHGIMNLTIHPSDRLPGVSEVFSFRARDHVTPPNYFPLMDIPFTQGRDFTPDERRRGGNAIVIGSDLARKLWGSADPIGRRLMSEPIIRRVTRDTLILVVVGVVDETRAGLSSEGNDIRIFTPLIGFGETILVRTRQPADVMIPIIRSVASAEVPELPIVSARTLEDLENDERKFMLQASGAAAGSGLLALFLSAIALYAVVALAVSQRTREIGIRTALGADRGQVVQMFFLRGIRLSVLGLLIGLPLSLIALRIIATQAGIALAPMSVLAALVGTVVIGIAALATWIPARRAAVVDPLTALRHE